MQGQISLHFLRGSINRLYFLITSLSRSWGIAETLKPSIPVIDSAATSALIIASSVANIVAPNRRLILSFESICNCAVAAEGDAAPALAVEKAIKMSPEPLPAETPVLANHHA